MTLLSSFGAAMLNQHIPGNAALAAVRPQRPGRYVVIADGGSLAQMLTGAP
jgi:hypothetical protein